MAEREFNPAKRLAANALNRAREAPDERQRKLWEELAEAWTLRAREMEEHVLLTRSRRAAERASRQPAQQTRKG
jgi:hypothetical protein